MTAGVCKHAKTCPTRDAHEHMYVGGEKTFTGLLTNSASPL